jgi:LPS-assembly protein
VTGDLELQGKTRKIHGLAGQLAEIEDSRLLFRAREIEYNEETGGVLAVGDVFFHDFRSNDRLWATRVEYNTDDEEGTFYEVRGQTQVRIVERRGVLTSSNPFYFEGEWAERRGTDYVLHNGWITNCKLPNPWWKLRGPRFEIVPSVKAVSHHSVFVLKNVPLFYAPYFYHSLAEEPRKSGLLMPNIGMGKRGPMIGGGYFWAIDRTQDLTYRVQDYISRAYTQHVDYRAKLRPGTELGAVLYGVSDRGAPDSGDPPRRYSGVSIYAAGQSDLGGGWNARGNLNYISTFRFRQQWTESFNEAIASEIHSSGFVNKNWSTVSFNAMFARLQNFQSAEIEVTDPETKARKYLPNAVTIRKIPEVELNARDRRLNSRIPLWFSLESAAGLLFRSEPRFDADQRPTSRFETRQFTNRVNLSPHITSALHFWNFHLVPSLGFHETFYGESQGTQNNVHYVVGTNIVRSARDFSLDLVFPSLARVFDKKTVFGDKLKHVIEPRATYKYVTGIGDNFNRFIRFDEMDLLSDTNQLEISLANRLYAKRGNNVEEIFTWELVQRRYFDPTFGGALIEGQRNIFAATTGLSAYAFLVGPRSTSPIASIVRAVPVSGLSVQWQADYDPRAGGVVDSAFSADYRWQNYFVGAGHNQVHTDPLLTPPANQFRARLGLGDANRRGWNAGFEAVYDYRARARQQQALQYTTSQVTYNTDCCGLSAQYRYIGVRQQGEWRIAFSVANIGSFGNLRKQDRLF